MPNMAYVVDQPKPGVTIKAGQRGLLNLMQRHPDSGRDWLLGGSTDIGGSYDYRLKSVVNGSAYDYGEDWRAVEKRSYHGGTFHPLGPAEGGIEFGFTDGVHSWLTMGEYRAKALSVVKPHEDLEPLESDHPLRRLVENPNPFDTHYDIEYEKWMFKLLTGVSYEWIPPNRWGVPAERWCFPSHWVWPRTGGGRYVAPDNPHADELIQYFEIRPWGGMGSAGMLKIPPDEIIMEVFKSPINKIDGYSPLAAMAQWIDLDESISKSRWAQMMNQARPELVIKLGPGYEDPTDDQIIRLESKLAARFQGEYNYAKPIVLPPGAEAAPLSYSPNEMAYGDGSDQTRDMILSGFLVPPAAVGLSREMTYGCLDTETECLTDCGWKRYTELTTETRVACYDPNANAIVYHSPSKIHAYPYQGKMHRWNNSDVDALLTPSHRAWLTEPANSLREAIAGFTLRMVDSLAPDGNYVVMIPNFETNCKVNPFLYARLNAVDRTVEDYTGEVWCLTVPTGLFVVRRDGKPHVTGNSILATLSALCEFNLNTKLASSGQTQTKFLASRFDERAPAYSTFNSAGGRASRRRVRLWYDNCTPADPQQVNSDISTDLQGYALTPNELRALRGRKPYRHGGDDPMGPGPGGVIPVTMNTGDSLEALAQQLEPMVQMGQQGRGNGAGNGTGVPQDGEGGPEQGHGAGNGDGTRGASSGPLNRLPSQDGEAPETDFAEDVGIEEPNQKPTKYWENGRSKDKHHELADETMKKAQPLPNVNVAYVTEEKTEKVVPCPPRHCWRCGEPTHRFLTDGTAECEECSKKRML